MMESHFNESILNDLPAKFRELNERKSDNNMSECQTERLHLLCITVYAAAVDEPNLDKFVFCRIATDLGELQMDDRCVR